MKRLLAIAAIAPFGLLIVAAILIVRRVRAKRREREATVSPGWLNRGGGGL